MTSVWPDALFLHDDAIEFKRIMENSIQRAMDQDHTLTRKRIAMELGATPSDLSHWLSSKTRFTMPGHLIKRFCAICKDNELAYFAFTEEGPGSDSQP